MISGLATMNIVVDPFEPLDLNDSDSSTMMVDWPVFMPCGENSQLSSLPQPEGSFQTPLPWRVSEPLPLARRRKTVNFDKAIQVREIRHLNDMSPSERSERWASPEDLALELLASIFDEDVEDDNIKDMSHATTDTTESKKYRRRVARAIRRQFLAQYTQCLEAATKAVACYSEWSQECVMRAHTTALAESLSMQGYYENDSNPSVSSKRPTLESNDYRASSKRLKLMS